MATKTKWPRWRGRKRRTELIVYGDRRDVDSGNGYHSKSTRGGGKGTELLWGENVVNLKFGKTQI